MNSYYLVFLPLAAAQSISQEDYSLIQIIVGVTLALIILVAICLKLQYRHQDNFLAKKLPEAKKILYHQILAQENIQVKDKEIARLNKELAALEAIFNKKEIPKDFSLEEFDKEINNSWS